MERQFVTPDENLERLYRDVRSLKRIPLDQEKTMLKNLTPENRRRILESHQRYVLKLAKGFSRKPEVITELVSEGNIGMVEAMDKFDPKSNNGFLAFASLYIYRKMVEFFESSTLIREHKGICRAKNLANRFREAYFSEYGIMPPEDMVVDHLKSIKTLRYSDTWGSIDDTEYRSVDEKFKDEDDDNIPADSVLLSFASHNAVEDTIERESNEARVSRFIDTLKPIEKIVISKTFGIGCSPCSDYEIMVYLNERNSASDGRETFKIKETIKESNIWKIRERALKKMRFSTKEHKDI